ncbi:GNAT family N-acetyltransferase [Leptothoe sp. LEGE 181152]|nr:GNAT family N-acetyltransferase [Leptothoe sp. LEGE 181152]
MAQSTAHHGVSGLCYLHPHLGEDCKRQGVQVAKIDLISHPEQQNSQAMDPITLASDALRQKFGKILSSEGGNVDELEVAIALFTFELDPWPTACMVSLKTIDGKKVDSAVCINGKCLPYKSLSIPNGRLFSPAMDKALTYRPLNVTDTREVSELVARGFNEFVAPECSSEGVQEFHRYIQSNAFRTRAQTNHFSLITLDQDKIVGVIEMRDHHHISLLFVTPEFQYRGIAKELLRQALQICRANRSRLSEISVNSSSYAVPIYEKLGFRAAGERQVKNGIGFIPMVLKLKNQPDDSHRL